MPDWILLVICAVCNLVGAWGFYQWGRRAAIFDLRKEIDRIKADRAANFQNSRLRASKEEP